MRRNRLIIMLKHPQAGQVKTRLGKDIGMTSAAQWFRVTSSALIRRLADPRWETLLSVAPDRHLNSRAWGGEHRRIAQGQGNLGQRMQRLLSNAPSGRVVIIGGDIPGIQPNNIAQAFQSLGPNDLVFGPATDGGFWLVGAKRSTRAVPKTLFENTLWSSSKTLETAMRSVKSEKTGLVQTLSDIDTGEDLKNWMKTLRPSGG